MNVNVKKLQPYIVVFVVTLAIDFVTKWWIESNVLIFQSIKVIDGFFSIVHVRNRGAAFGFLSDLNIDNEYRQIFFIVITIAMAALIIYLMLKENNKLAKYAYTLILSGAAGNLIDRVNSGVVIDFLDFRIGDFAWPAFNVADICITVGVGLLVYLLIFTKKLKK